MTDPTEQVAEAIRDRLAQHGYAMSLDTAGDLARAAIDALQLTGERRLKHNPDSPVFPVENNFHWETRLVSKWIKESDESPPA